MTTIEFLAEWALRSSVLILAGALLLRALRVKDASVRLAAWAALLCGSLAIPALTAALPRVPMMAAPAARVTVDAPAAAGQMATLPAAPRPVVSAPPRFDWARAAAMLYLAVALALLLRLAVGLALSLRLRRASLSTGRFSEGIEIRESPRVRAPVTLGVFGPAIVLPSDWRDWEEAKLQAVLAHERSHIRRHDPALQAISAIHRAALWHSPLSWFLHSRIVRVAEEASDDAAVTATRDRAFYAEVLLQFVPTPGGLGVPMARYARPDQRIHRILDETALPRGVTRGSLAAILALGLPLACLVAAAGPQSARPKAVPAAPASKVAENPAAANQPQAAPPSAAPKAMGDGTFLIMGNVAPLNTVIVKCPIDGQLLSVSIKEGDLVQAGELVATVDARPFEIQQEQAEAHMAQDEAALNAAQQELTRMTNLGASNVIPKPQVDSQAATVAQLRARLYADTVAVQGAKLQRSYGHILAPITGVVGLRRIDPGNIVHASDPNGILVITQLQPIAVLFGIPEDDLPRVRERLAEGANTPVVEAWNRDNTVRLATGRLTAIDNQIDADTGTARLKAVFDNQDGALFPNQFVNVRLNLGAR